MVQSVYGLENVGRKDLLMRDGNTRSRVQVEKARHT